MVKLCLIDGYGFVFRAYHSLPPLTRPDGAQVAAVYGFVNMILKLLETHQPDMIAVALDSGGQNHRHAILPSYKAHRPSIPDDLKLQLPMIREALAALNIVALEDPQQEADDLIATYAVHAIKIGHQVQVVSSDKDLMQLLIHQGITLYCPTRGKEITQQVVKEKFGVEASQLRDFLSLVGDKSDNIHGIPGIGPKTAAELLGNHHSIQGIYDNIHELKSERIKKLMLEHRDAANLAISLIELKCDIQISYSFDDLQRKEIDHERFRCFAEKFGFKSLLRKLPKASSMNTLEHAAATPIIQITDLNAFQDVLRKGACEKTLALALENDKLLLGFKDRAYAVSYQTHNDLFEQDNQLTLHQLASSLKFILESNACKKILFNAKELLHTFRALDCNIVAFEDIALMSYLINSKEQYKNLEEFLNAKSVSFPFILKTYENLLLEMQKTKVLALCEKIEKPLVLALLKMEIKGVLLDRAILCKLQSEFNKRASDIEAEVHEIAGESFNLGSPKQLGFILFERMQIPGGKKSKKTGHYVTDSEVLEGITHPIAALIFQWRHLTKMVGTYTTALQRGIDDRTGRLHTTFEMTATATGRLSSRNPNLQNIPIKSEDGRKIRRAFIASPGHLLISADYSQIELRLLAHFADIKELKDAFAAGADIHRVTASEIFGVTQAEVSDELRRKAKGINFGIIYGISAFGLARNIGISQHAAKQYIAHYFQRYPGIKEYMNRTIAFAQEHKFVKTIMGRRCFIDGIDSGNYAVRAFAERAAINAPLQGSSADIIKKAMVLMPQNLAQYMTLQIHDELLFEVPEGIAEDAAKIIEKVMTQAVELSLPLKVDVNLREFW